MLNVQDKSFEQQLITLFYEACQKGYLEEVVQPLYRMAINAKVDLGISDHAGITALHLAVSQKHLAIVKFLLDENFYPEPIDQNGETPLHIACEIGNLALVKLLHAKNVTLDAQDNNSITPLHLASEKGHVPVVQFLMMQNVMATMQDCHGVTAFYRACEGGYLEIVQHLYQQNPSVLTIGDNYGNTPLHAACVSGKLAVIEYLHSVEADLNAQDHDGQTALHVACARADIKIVQFLIEKGASPMTVERMNHWTPLHTAISILNVQLVWILLNNKKYFPLLHAKAQNGYRAIDLAWLLLHDMDTHNRPPQEESEKNRLALCALLEAIEENFKDPGNSWNQDIKRRTFAHKVGAFHNAYEEQKKLFLKFFRYRQIHQLDSIEPLYSLSGAIFDTAMDSYFIEYIKSVEEYIQSIEEKLCSKSGEKRSIPAEIFQKILAFNLEAIISDSLNYHPDFRAGILPYLPKFSAFNTRKPEYIISKILEKVNREKSKIAHSIQKPSI